MSGYELIVCGFKSSCKYLFICFLIYLKLLVKKYLNCWLMFHLNWLIYLTKSIKAFQGFFLVEPKILILSLCEIWIKEHHRALNHVYDLTWHPTSPIFTEKAEIFVIFLLISEFVLKKVYRFFATLKIFKNFLYIFPID